MPQPSAGPRRPSSAFTAGVFEKVSVFSSWRSKTSICRRMGASAMQAVSRKRVRSSALSARAVWYSSSTFFHHSLFVVCLCVSSFFDIRVFPDDLGMQSHAREVPIANEGETKGGSAGHLEKQSRIFLAGVGEP